MIIFAWLLFFVRFVKCLTAEEGEVTFFTEEKKYDEAINALMLGHLEASDGSEGIVWFDTSSYELQLSGFPLIGLYSLKTERSYNYLDSLSVLAELAVDKGKHGDFVYIMYRFLYHGSLQDAVNPNYLLTREMAKGLSPKYNYRDGSEFLLSTLIETSSSSELELMYREIDNEASVLSDESYPSLVISAKKVY